MTHLRIESVLVALLLVSPIQESHAEESPPRARPPEWSQDVLDAFFEDARKHLVGQRPQPAMQAKGTVQPTVAQGQPANAGFRWSELIDGETLTAEIKRINNQLAFPLKKSASFQGGGNLDCRRNFGLLAVLFGVIDQFDKDVRWQRSAKLMQQRSLKMSQVCKTSSAQSYAAAKEAHAKLSELLRGQAPTGEVSAAAEGEQTTVEISTLMQSMELAVKERLSPALANTREFRKRSQMAAEQAQLLAALAVVIQQEGYDYADDDTYLDEARQLRLAAGELAEAAQEKNYEAARAAAGRVGQSCSRCHEDYRG